MQDERGVSRCWRVVKRPIVRKLSTRLVSQSQIFSKWTVESAKEYLNYVIKVPFLSTNQTVSATISTPSTQLT